MATMEESDLCVIDLKEDDDGDQDVRLFKQPAGKLLLQKIRKGIIFVTNPNEVA